MKVLPGLRVIFVLFAAVMLPLEQAHCALMPLFASSGAATAHGDGDDHDCCDEPSSSPEPVSPADDCCCACIQSPMATAPASVSLPAPSSEAALPALVPTRAFVVATVGTSVRVPPDARSGSPPDPAIASQSPRSPPCFA